MSKEGGGIVEVHRSVVPQVELAGQPGMETHQVIPPPGLEVPPSTQVVTEQAAILVVQELVVVVLSILCILITLVPTTILISHYSSLPITKRNLLTRFDQLLVFFMAFAICYQVGVRCQVSYVRCQV